MKLCYLWLILLLLSGCELFSDEEPLLDVRTGVLLVNTIHAYPTWSSDGEWIIFAKIPDTFQEDTLQNGIYKVRPDGRDKTFITDIVPDYLLWGLSLSPDGNWFLINYGTQIAKLTVEGDSLTMLTNTGRNFFPRWSPNGEHIVYDSNVGSETGAYSVWLMDSNGNDKKRIGETGSRSPVWGINHIYYNQNAPDFMFTELFRMNPDGSNKTQLTFNEFEESDLHVSPYTNDMLVVQDFRIWSMDGEAENARVLTERAEMARYPAWSPDGQQIVYTNTDLNNGYLWIMNKDGSGKRQLTFPN